MKEILKAAFAVVLVFNALAWSLVGSFKLMVWIGWAR